ncbi:MAG: molybdopterin-dependent oxidoreductase [Deltaproteobacteria bacterium]|nr:molybdopterin-dependent oxidoreductase [Deltaproteobacteria bacterium]MBW2307077.1 molybdopterin-dependent oxidoreductase [Deltaproteobacteria bacterium]
MSVLKRLNVPVFKAGGMISVDPSEYTLASIGMVKEEKRFTWKELEGLPRTTVNARLTSVSGWSVRADWDGILWRDFLNTIAVEPAASHVVFVSINEGYRTTVSLTDLDHPRVLMATGVRGEPLETEYGGPLRMVIPHLYGYKSCKWLGTIQFTDHVVTGYWEARGYTESGIIEPGFTLDVNTNNRREIPGGEVTDF